jgi:hypothetical protein
MYASAAEHLQSYAKNIKMTSRGVINLPTFKQSEISQLVLAMVKESEDVVPSWAAPYDVQRMAGGSCDVAPDRELAAAVASEEIAEFVDKRIRYRAGSYAILMAFHEYQQSPSYASRQHMTREEICRVGQRYMDDMMAPDHRTGRLRGVGWDSRNSLLDHGFIFQGSNARGADVRWLLTAKGKQCVDYILRKWGDPTAASALPPPAREPGLANQRDRNDRFLSELGAKGSSTKRRRVGVERPFAPTSQEVEETQLRRAMDSAPSRLLES